MPNTSRPVERILLQREFKGNIIGIFEPKRRRRGALGLVVLNLELNFWAWNLLKHLALSCAKFCYRPPAEEGEEGSSGL